MPSAAAMRRPPALTISAWYASSKSLSSSLLLQLLHVLQLSAASRDGRLAFLIAILSRWDLLIRLVLCLRVFGFIGSWPMGVFPSLVSTLVFGLTMGFILDRSVEIAVICSFAHFTHFCLDVCCWHRLWDCSRLAKFFSDPALTREGLLRKDASWSLSSSQVVRSGRDRCKDRVCFCKDP